MRHNVIQAAMLAAVLLFGANLALAATDKTPAAGSAKALSAAKAADKAAKAKKAKAAAKVKLVDINSADKAELKTLPGISDVDADKIIAGRPYLSKARLSTRKIISRDVYEGLKKLVIAKQKEDVKSPPPKSK